MIIHVEKPQQQIYQVLFEKIYAGIYYSVYFLVKNPLMA